MPDTSTQFDQLLTTGDEVISNYTINFGPQHPAAYGMLRLGVKLDGEIIARIDPHIGAPAPQHREAHRAQVSYFKNSKHAAVALGFVQDK